MSAMHMQFQSLRGLGHAGVVQAPYVDKVNGKLALASYRHRASFHPSVPHALLPGGSPSWPGEPDSGHVMIVSVLSEILQGASDATQ